MISHDSTKEKLEILKQRLQRAKFDYQVYQGQEIGKRFPGLKFDENFAATYEPNGIVLKASKCLVALKVKIGVCCTVGLQGQGCKQTKKMDWLACHCV